MSSSEYQEALYIGVDLFRLPPLPSWPTWLTHDFLYDEYYLKASSAYGKPASLTIKASLLACSSYPSKRQRQSVLTGAQLILLQKFAVI